MKYQKEGNLLVNSDGSGRWDDGEKSSAEPANLSVNLSIYKLKEKLDYSYSYSYAFILKDTQ